MAKFRFRFESVLRYREEQEKQARDVYLGCQARRIDTERRIDEVANTLSECLNRGLGNLNEMMSMQNYLDKLDDEVQELKIVLDVLQQEEERAHEAWIESKKEADVLARLKEKRFEDWCLEETRAEQRELDEFATFQRAA